MTLSTFVPDQLTDEGTGPVDEAAQRDVEEFLRRIRCPLGYVAAALGITATWAAAIWAATRLEADPLLHESALFMHLSALLVGMGAVITLDWLGLRWLTGRMALTDMLRATAGCHVLIWAGLAVLVLSGVVLAPDPTATLTQLKLLAVLIVGLNGLNAHALQHRLEEVDGITWRLLLRAGCVATISQAAWWAAVVVGFLNARS